MMKTYLTVMLIFTWVRARSYHVAQREEQRPTLASSETTASVTFQPKQDMCASPLGNTRAPHPSARHVHISHLSWAERNLRGWSLIVSFFLQ